MRLLLDVLVVSIGVAGSFQVALGQQTTEPPQATLSVQCRLIDENDHTLIAPKLILHEGEQGTIQDQSQSPFVTGVTPIVGPFATAQQPHITVLDEGTTIQVKVYGRQASGISIDATVERSRITKVDTKTLPPTEGMDSKGSGTTIQIPRVETQKQRVFDFAIFGHPLVIPLGQKRFGRSLPRVELVVTVNSEIPSNQSSPVPNGPQKLSAAQRHASPSQSMGESLMSMVTPRIIIQGEEEERLEIAQP